MRRVLLALLGVLALSGCMSTLQGAYDDRARDECLEERRGPDRLDC